MPSTIPHLRATAEKVFLAHAGLADPVAGYGVTPWRQWLITGVVGVWFVVSKSDPTAKPRAYRCSLAQTKANLLAGY